jgi:uncharacterized protein YpbB
MILQSRIRSSGLFSYNRIVQFSKSGASANQLQIELEKSRKNYQLAMLISTFDFAAAINETNEILKYINEYISSFNPEVLSWIQELLNKANKLQETALKFHLKLQSLFLQSELPKENTVMQERIEAGTDYFKAELQGLLQFIQQSPAITDSRLHAKEYNESIKEIFALLSFKRFLLEGIIGPVDIEAFHRHKMKFVLPPFTVNAYAGSSQQKTESKHPTLYHQLRKLRDNICAKKDVPIYMVAGSNTINEMAEYLPQTPEELMQVSGFGKIKVDAYGEQFLELIQQYCKENNLTSRIAEKIPKRQRKEQADSQRSKIDTKAETYKLYRQGMSIGDIAKSRNLAVQTIEGHLAYYVQRGEINIEELINPDKLLLIRKAIQDFKGGPMTLIKEKLGSNIGFGEIRLAIAWAQFKNIIES